VAGNQMSMGRRIKELQAAQDVFAETPELAALTVTAAKQLATACTGCTLQ
jgi:hypothetical protein